MALEYFYFLHKVEMFDPHVGDTLCQIRAYKFSLLKKQAKEKIHNDYIKKKSRGQVQAYNLQLNEVLKIADICFNIILIAIK